MKVTKPIILASGSPRRFVLLKNAGIKFRVVESKFVEQIDPKLKPQEVAEKFSLEKAREVYKNHRDSIIIAADTLVFLDEQILGKPKDQADAKRMISMLSNNSHCVITAFTIIDDNKIVTRSVITKISMKNIDKAEIEKYIKTKEPYDKAGAYATQGWARKYITKIQGDESSAIGLPVKSLLKELKNLGAF